MIAAATIPLLAELFQLSEEDVAELHWLRQLASDSRRAWWLDHLELLGPETTQYLGLEYGANKMRTYSSVLVNGLLQTEEYALRQLQGSMDVSKADYARLLRVRMQRQQRLHDEHPLHLQTVMSEAVLHCEYGSTAVLRGQLSHLAASIESMPEHLDVRILPFAAPVVTAAAASTYVLLDFTSPYMPTAIWQEAVRPIGLSLDAELAEYMHLAQEEVVANSLDREASFDLIVRTAEELRRRS